MILRKWTSRIRKNDEQAYVDYVNATGISDYASTPGNLGFQMLLRDVDEHISEVTTLSWWIDFDSIRAFAGDDFMLARYYPKDDQFLLERPEHVDHFRVVSQSMPSTPDES